MQSPAALPDGRVRRKRKSQPPSTPSVVVTAPPSADAWDELEQQIEQTLSEHPAPPLSGSAPLSHSYSTPSLSASHAVGRAVGGSTPSWLSSSATPEQGSPACYVSSTSPASSYVSCSSLSPALSSPSYSSASFSPVFASPSSSSSPLAERVSHWQPRLAVTSSSSMLDGARLKQLARQKLPDFSAPSSSFCLLQSLYHDLLLRCLDALDIPSLCRASTTCRWLRSASEDWQLWSELYVSRWPVDRERTECKERWKSDYRDKEVQEEAAFFAQDNDNNSAARHSTQGDEMAVAGLSAADMEAQWRHLYRATLRRNRQLRRHTNEFALIQSFSDSHQPEAGHSAVSPQRCSFLSCAFHLLLPDLYVCRSSHRAHFCAPACWAEQPDSRCRVTGRWATETDRSAQRIDGEDETDAAADEEAAAMEGAGQTRHDFLMSMYEQGADAVAVNGELSIWAREGREEDETSADEAERRRRETMQMESAFSSDSKRRQSGGGHEHGKRRRVGSVGHIT